MTMQLIQFGKSLTNTVNNELLIIADTLVEPPSESFAFRTVTMITHDDLDMEILFHTTQEMKDLYYRWMKPMGLLDYIVYILNEREWVDGIRIDVTGIYPDTIVVKYIRLENQIRLLGMIKSYKSSL